MWVSSLIIFTLLCCVYSANKTLNLNLTQTSKHDDPILPTDTEQDKGLQCLRLYCGKRYKGEWSDLCTSNELLLTEIIFHTKSVCAPKDDWWSGKTYWLLFEQPHFQGRFLILSEKQCVASLEKSSATLGSVLKCTQSAITDAGISCDFPKKPWRKFVQLSEEDIRKRVKEDLRFRAETWFESTANGSRDKISFKTLEKTNEGAVNWKKFVDELFT